MRDWSRTPHVRVGDPCYDCGISMVPASRRWSSFTIPPGHRKHGGFGLCRICYGRRVRTDTMGLDQ